MRQIKRALLSVTDKTGIVEFARCLARHGVELISTGGTAKLLRESELSVRDVADVTGFPEMMGGRVKTLHPGIAAGILAVRSNPAHMAALAGQNVEPIDMVVVNLYAFASVAAKPDTTFEEVLENIDIGGPTMIRAAAKNFRDVAVVVSSADYEALGRELDDQGGSISPETRWRLAQRAFALTAAYDRAISRTLCSFSLAGKRAEKDEPLPQLLDIAAPKKQELRYGENPHQSGALYASGGEGIAGARQLHGKDLSYNNLVDLDAAWSLIGEFSLSACAIIKHTNPCGCAEQETSAGAFRKALECDPLSAFGSVLAFNCTVDEEAAEAVAELFVEAIAAPEFSPAALKVLTRKKSVRLLEVEDSAQRLVMKSISGGYLAQTNDDLTIKHSNLRVVTARQPAPEENEALTFAWKVVKHVKSNAIVYANRGQTVGVGAGQMSRVDAARLGASKAALPLKGTVAASDAFFPFPDGVEEIAKHGSTAVIQPGGSVRDDEVIAAADRLGLAMVFTGLRHFRH